MHIRRWPRCSIRHWLLIMMVSSTSIWLLWIYPPMTTTCSTGSGTILDNNNAARHHTQPRSDTWGEAVPFLGKPRLRKGNTSDGRRILSDHLGGITDQYPSVRGHGGHNRPRSVVLGNHHSAGLGFLTIGIPTVCRENGTYILSTIQSLIDHSTDTDRQNVTIVIAVNDHNATYISELEHSLTDDFSAYVLNGFIHVITPPDSYYPPLDSLRSTFGDAQNRVKWRSKQNLDYAFLMNYAKNISEYYLQLEDDVTAAEGYVQKIRSYIHERKHPWTMLDFSVMGYIGKLYKSVDIPKLANLLRSFYNEQPCDFLLLHFLNLMLQRKRFVRIPTLFNHVGYHSSLSNTTRHVVDVYFEGRVKTHQGDNPPAKLYSTIDTFEDNYISMAYNKSNTGRFFWGRNPNSGDTITVVFDDPQNISGVAIETGHFADPERDRAHGAILEYGRRYTTLVKPPSCIPIAVLGSFTEGRLDYHNGTIPDVQCLQITFSEKHKQWLIVKEIAVFLTKL